MIRALLLSLFSGKPDAEPGRRPRLEGLDAIGHLHEQAGGDLFLLNHLERPEPPSRSPDLYSQPYEGHLGEIYIPAVPMERLEATSLPCPPRHTGTIPA